MFKTKTKVTLKLYIISHLYGYEVVLAESKERAIELVKEHYQFAFPIQVYEDQIEEYSLQEGYIRYCGE